MRICKECGSIEPKTRQLMIEDEVIEGCAECMSPEDTLVDLPDDGEKSQ